MKNLKISSVLIIVLLISYSCRVNVPRNDTASPTITVSVIDDEAQVIRSTNPDIEIDAFTCPSGTDQAGASKCCYVTTIANNSVDFRIVATDQGGVKSISSTVYHNQVSNVRILNDASVTPTVTPLSGGNTRISATFSEPRSSYILAFQVNNAGSILSMDVIANDFSNNAASIPTVNSGETSIQVLDLDSNCNN